MTDTMDKSKKIKEFFSVRKSRLVLTILVSIALGVALFVAPQIDIYASNSHEFSFEFSEFAPYVFLWAGICVFSSFCILYLVPQKAYKIVFAIFLSLALILYMQQNFLNWGVNSLPGDSLGENGPSTILKILNALIWVVIFGGFVTLACLKDKKGIINTIILILTIVVFSANIIGPVTNLISKKSIYEKKGVVNYVSKDEELEILTEKGITNLATERNVFYFVIDRFDEEYAETAYEKYDGIYSLLNGFTWYKDNISAYGHTYPAITNMLTNAELNEKDLRGDFFNSAYSNSNVPIKKLHDLGYSINIYSSSYYSYEDANQFPSYVDNVLLLNNRRVVSKKKIASSITAFSMFKSVPLFFKKNFISLNTDRINSYVKCYSEDGYEKFSTDTKNNFELASKEFEYNATKKFTFIHINGCHEADYNDSWERSPYLNDRTISVKNSFKILDKYFSEMKRTGIYKDATIIITGDHSAPHNDKSDVNEPRLTALFVKKSGEDSGEVRQSTIQSSHKNVWATIFDSEGLDYSDFETLYGEDYSKSLTEIALNGGSQKRTFTWHTYTKTLEVWKYEINGAGNVFSNWKETEHSFYKKSIMK